MQKRRKYSQEHKQEAVQLSRAELHNLLGGLEGGWKATLAHVSESPVIG